MTGPGPKSQEHASPLKVAFYGLTASELDLFTIVRRHPGASLVMVIDPGPMGLARRLAEIAGVSAAASPWDLAGANIDLVVVGGLVQSRGAALERAQEEGVEVVDAASAITEIARLTESLAAEASDYEKERTGEVGAELPEGIEVVGADSSDSDVESEISVHERPTETTVGEPLKSAHLPGTEVPSEPGLEQPLPVAAQADTEDSPAAPAVPRVPAASPQVEGPAPLYAAPISAESGHVAQRTKVVLHPLESAAEPASVVNWALEGLMSSVRGGWGAALARANKEICFVEKGIDLQERRPDLWRWLNEAMLDDDGVVGDRKSPPKDSGNLAWALLRTDTGVVGAMLLGREEDADPFSSSDRTWLERVGERVASILCYTVGSDLGSGSIEVQDAPASVWAAPILDRVRWARGWLRGLLNAKNCWLFIAPGTSSVPQLVDEKWDAAGPPFLQDTVQEALERREPQVWVEGDGARALVLQPLGPWGVKGLLLIEGVPWKGGGRAAMGRLKKAAAIIAKLLRNT
jgi:hypothetical protein